MSSPSKPDAHFFSSNSVHNKAVYQDQNPPSANQEGKGTPKQLFGFAELKRHEETLLRERRRVAFGASSTSSEGETSVQFHEEPPTNQDAAPHGAEESIDREESSEFADVVGLALSGGGLRSALFNDGFLRALSHRGLLRYVDYLCSVSGGGYIAGHLLTKAQGGDGDRKPQNFYATNPQARSGETECNQSSQPAWWLGVNPDNGKVDAEHLPNVGSYLQSTWNGMVSFVRHQVATKCVYIGLLGTVATLLALCFRSFDEPVYRMVVDSDIGVLDGGEIVFSFLPTIAVTVLLVISVGIDSLLRATNRLWSQGNATTFIASAGRIAHRLVGWLLFLSIFFLVTSVAVSIGNSLTSARRGESEPIHLNYFANYIALIAGAIQILVFLGRDRLFKSEKSEAANWQKVLQSVVTYAVVGIAFFAFVHLMACENVSHFANHRDPFLLRGEILDWRRLHQITQETISLKSAGTEEDPLSAFNEQFPIEEIDRALYASQVSPSESSKYLTGNLLNGRTQSLFGTPGRETPQPAIPNEFRAPESELSNLGRTTRLALYSFLPATIADVLGDNQSSRAEQMIQRQTKFVDYFNKTILVDPSFTDYLTNRLHIKFQGQSTKPLYWDATASGGWGGNSTNVAIDVAQHSPPASSKLQVDREWLQQHAHTWNHASCEEFCSLIQWHLFNATDESTKQSSSPMSGDSNSSRLPADVRVGEFVSADVAAKLKTAELNHYLLELIGGKLLVSHADISTRYIQPHDQQARMRWLVVWLSLLVFGLLATIDLNAIIYAYYFYRGRIATHFLKKQPEGRFCGETMLDKLKPTEHGLPFPIYQAAWQRPNQAADSFQIESENVTFTPLGVHLWDRNLAGGASDAFDGLKEQSAVAVSPDPIRLKDAVAISGSAVTPLMTNNIALAAILDFFGGRIGRWLKFQHQKSDQASQTYDKGPVVLVLVAICIICLTFTGLSLILKLLIIAACLLFAIGHCFNLGYPYLLANMFLPRGTRAASLGDQLTEASKRWPRAFVADGGFYDFLGVNELIRRRCKLIIVSDAGVNAGEHTLSSLAKMCHGATSQQGVRFLDIDHDAPIDFGRLNRDDRRLVAQPFLAMRIKYPEIEECGLLFYAQMAITESDPIEIQQIRHCFPSFPDEPTTNQFYTDEQVEAYQHLGYHIGNRLCNNMHRWEETEIWQESRHKPQHYSGSTQPLLGEVEKRLKRAYVQACYEEMNYREDDVYGESIWTGNCTRSRFPSFASETLVLHQIEVDTDAVLSSGHSQDKVRDRLRVKCNHWLQKYMTNADIAAAYLESVCSVVNRDVYEAGVHRNTTSSLVAAIVNGTAVQSNEMQFDLGQDFNRVTKHCYAAHLAVLAISSQQLHRGSPAAIFQIGGRSKLVSTVVKLTLDIAELLRQYDENPSEDGFPDFANEASKRIVNEVIELRSSVFLDADDQAAVSFAQCVCHELSELALERPAMINAPHTVSCNSYADFRQLLQESLKSGYITQAQGILAEYINALGGGTPVCRPGTELVKRIPTRSR